MSEAMKRLSEKRVPRTAARVLSGATPPEILEAERLRKQIEESEQRLRDSFHGVRG